MKRLAIDWRLLALLPVGMISGMALISAGNATVFDVTRNRTPYLSVEPETGRDVKVVDVKTIYSFIPQRPFYQGLGRVLFLGSIVAGVCSVNLKDEEDQEPKQLKSFPKINATPYPVAIDESLLDDEWDSEIDESDDEAESDDMDFSPPDNPIEALFWRFNMQVEVTDVIESPSFRRHFLDIGNTLKPSTKEPTNTGVKAEEVGKRTRELQVALGAIKQPIFNQDRHSFFFDVPRDDREFVLYEDLIDGDNIPSEVPTIAFGVDVNNTLIEHPLDRIVHLLIAGSTGGGKSSTSTAAIASLCERYSPEQLQIWGCDAKGGASFELGVDLPHFSRHLSVDQLDWIETLQSAEEIRSKRQDMFNEVGAANLTEFNEITGSSLPWLVVWLEEFGDLFDTQSHPKMLCDELIGLVSSLTRLARSAGITLVLTTQRPEIKLVPGQIRNNCIFRMAFACTEDGQASTILGFKGSGADRLIGKGDALLLDDTSSLTRLQGLFIPKASRQDISERIREKWSDVAIPSLL